MGLLERPAERTSSLHLKPWTVCIFKNWPFSFYIVTASESNEGLVIFRSVYIVKLQAKSLDLELTLFYPCHNKNNPSPKSTRRGWARTLKFDTYTTHGLFAEFKGLGV